MSDQNLFFEVQSKVEALEAKVSALEEYILALPIAGNPLLPTKKTAVALSGDTFKVGKDTFKAKFPSFLHEGKVITEEELLNDKNIQESLVKGGFGVIQKITAMIVLMLVAIMPLSATTVVINPVTAEIVSTSFKVRTMYAANELIYIYRSSNNAFEVQVKATRSKIFGGVVDSVTISGASTTALKLAQLRLFFLETTTTTGFRSFIGRGNLTWEFTSATNVLRINSASNNQMQWFGHIDSLQVSGISGVANKLTWLRATANRPYQIGQLSGGTVASIAAGAAAGVSPTVVVTGNGVAGEITITTGASTTATGILATVTLPITAPTGNRVSITASNDNGASAIAQIFATTTTTTIVLNCRGTALTAGGTVYKYFYQVTSF